MEISDIIDDQYYLKQAQFPRGIYSHEAAYMFHGLSSFTPFYFYMTFPTGTVVKYGGKDELRVYYLDEPCFSCGVETIKSWLGGPIQVTDLERTMIDLLQDDYGHHFLFDEILSNYLWDKKKDLKRLKVYAKLFNLEDVVQEKIMAPFEKNEY